MAFKANKAKDKLMAELLLFDVGNTAIKIAIANQEQTLKIWTLPTKIEQTADALGISLLILLQNEKIALQNLRICLIASVVPPLNGILAEAVTNYLNCEIIFVPENLAVPLNNHYLPAEATGADRLVGTFAIRRLYPDIPAFILVGLGTAVTFDCLVANDLCGGLIFPGPQTAINALSKNASKLPHINLDIADVDPSHCLAKTTEAQMQYGLLFGFVAMIENLSSLLKAQMQKQYPDQATDIKLFAGGGFAKTLARMTKSFQAIMPAPVIEGLRLLYYQT